MEICWIYQLDISKELLNFLNTDNGLSKEEGRYVLSFTHKVIRVLMFELGKMN